MRKLLLVKIALATLAIGALASDHAQATPLGASAGARGATENVRPIEWAAYRRAQRRAHYRGHHYGYRLNSYRHDYRSYRKPSRYNSPYGGGYYR